MNTENTTVIKMKTEKPKYDILDEEGCLLLKKEIKKRNKLDSLYMKTLPSLFFILFLLIFCLILIRFIPNFLSASRSHHFYRKKDSVKYIPEYFGEEGTLIKGLIFGSQMVFALTIMALTAMIRQRISVPELIAEKGKNYLISFTSIISVFSMITLTLFKEKTNSFTRHYIGLVDNIFYVIYLISSLVICCLSYYLLKKVDVFCLEKDSKFLFFKKMILTGMIINLSIYFSCLIIISYYQPIIPVEQRFTNVLMIVKEVNSILFVFQFLLFVLTMKNDLNYIQGTLENRPDLEFFINADQNSKYILYEKCSKN